MKKILFDLFNAQPSKTSKFHGGGEYIKAIFNTLVQEYTDNVEIIPFYDDVRYLDPWIFDLIASKNLRTYIIKNINEVQRITAKEQIDVFFSGLPEHFKPEWFSKKTRLVGTVHGLRKIEKPHDIFEYKYLDGKKQWKCRLQLLKWKLVGGTARYKAKFVAEQSKVIDMLDDVICDSWHSYYALKYYFDIDESHLYIFYPPPKKVEKAEELERKYIENKYILLLGGDRWLKNSYRALKAIDSLYSKKCINNTKTILVGNISETIKRELNNREMFVWLSYVESNELENLYKNCELFVYPSLNEGFGYPPLEAMKYNKTCVVSAVCSLPEICGEAVYYTNPYDVEEIANRILHGLEHQIPEETIVRQMYIINTRQENDLERIVRLIIEFDR